MRSDDDSTSIWAALGCSGGGLLSFCPRCSWLAVMIASGPYSASGHRRDRPNGKGVEARSRTLRYWFSAERRRNASPTATIAHREERARLPEVIVSQRGYASLLRRGFPPPRTQLSNRNCDRQTGGSCFTAKPISSSAAQPAPLYIAGADWPCSVGQRVPSMTPAAVRLRTDTPASRAPETA